MFEMDDLLRMTHVDRFFLNTVLDALNLKYFASLLLREKWHFVFFVQFLPNPFHLSFVELFRHSLVFQIHT